jgi:hypothetical protein
MAYRLITPYPLVIKINTDNVAFVVAMVHILSLFRSPCEEGRQQKKKEGRLPLPKRMI